MNAEWQAFTQTLDLAGAASSENVNLYALDDLGLIRVEGEDAETFLQGQLTCDVREVTPTHASFGAYCTAKGRALALFRVISCGGGYMLMLPRDTLEATLKRLRMFVLMSKVTLVDMSEEWVVAGLSAKGLGGTLAAAGLELGPEAGAGAEAGNVCAVRPVEAVNDEAERALLVGPANDVISQCKALDARAADRDGWRLLDIRAGLPVIYAANSEAFVPQMLNLHALGGISFKKGCYTGQEVVARMYYLGKLKRRMYRAHTADGQARVGADIYAAGDAGGQSVGRVVEVCTADGGFELLLVAQTAAVDKGSLCLESPQGPALALLEIPYIVPLQREG